MVSTISSVSQILNNICKYRPLLKDCKAFIKIVCNPMMWHHRILNIPLSPQWDEISLDIFGFSNNGTQEHSHWTSGELMCITVHLSCEQRPISSRVLVSDSSCCYNKIP
jgi:hypothetical protein